MQAGLAMTTGVENTIIGAKAGDALISGSYNTALGYAALGLETTHGKNTAIGWGALDTLNAGANGNNVALGYNSGTAMTTGLKNTCIGTEAGDALTTGSNNIIIGFGAAASAVGVDNETVIGTATTTNALVHGLVKPVARVTGNVTTSLANTLYNFVDTTARVVTLPDCATLSLGATFEFVMTGKPGSGSHKVICHTDTVLRGQVIAVAINANNTTATTSTSTTIFTPQVTTIPEGGAADDLGLAFNGTTTGAIGTRVKFTVTGADEMFVEGFVHHSGSVSTPFVTS